MYRIERQLSNLSGKQPATFQAIQGLLFKRKATAKATLERLRSHLPFTGLNLRLKRTNR